MDPGKMARGSVGLLSLLLLLLIHLTAASGLSYFCLFPQNIRPGSDLRVSVTIYKATGSVNLRASLVNNVTGDVVVTKSQNVNFKNTAVSVLLSLKVPIDLTDSVYAVEVSGSGGLTFSNSSVVTVHLKTLTLLIQTDKAMYKPGQNVLLRSVAIYPDLRPYKGWMNITVYDKNNNRIAQWLKQKQDTGVFSGQLPLSNLTSLGTWTIEVKTPVDSAKKTFEVAEYVLPKFEVDVELPSFYLLNVNQPDRQPPLRILVKAKYTFGKALKGSVKVIVSILRYPWETLTDSGFSWTKTLQLTNGQAFIEMPPANISWITPDSLKESVPGNVPAWTQLNMRRIVVTAVVTEAVTGVIQQSNNSVTCYTQKYNLAFLDITPDSFKPGLPLTLWLKLEQMDGSVPLPADILGSSGDFRSIGIEAVEVGSPWWLGESFDCRGTKTLFEAKLTASGIVSVEIQFKNNCSRMLTATFNDISTNTNLTATKRVDPFQSIAHVGLQVSISKTDSPVLPGDRISFRIQTTAAAASLGKVFAVLMSKGVIVLTKSLSISKSKTEFELTLNIDAKLAQQLCPQGRFVAWAVVNGNEIISDSVEFLVEGIFRNPVSLEFSESQVEPGQDVKLRVKASGLSTAYLLAVDQSVRLLKGGNDITQDKVLDGLRDYESPSSGHWGIWRRPGFFLPFFPRAKDSAEVFNNARLIFLTDGDIYNRAFWPVRGPINPVFVDGARPGVSKTDTPLEGGGDEGGDFVRKRFPEILLWTNTTIGSDGVGTIDLKAPDTITSWVATAFAMHRSDGLGIAPIAANLTVFRPFFVSLTLPSIIRRGEGFQLKATVFNYLDRNLRVQVTLMASTSFSVRVSGKGVMKDNMNVTVTISVAQGDSATAMFDVLLNRVGLIPFEVVAFGGVARDGERRTVLVVPEGLAQHQSSSVLVDHSKSPQPTLVTLNLTLPVSDPDVIVPDSVRSQISVVGDIFGAFLSDPGSLVAMPYGCGEQIMLTLSPDLYVLRYLKATNRLTPEVEENCKKYIRSGYQSELTFQRYDGMFSAFGNNDPAGSIWLSAFVVKDFFMALSVIPVDEARIAMTIYMMINLQNKNGSFTEPPNGRVIHTDMQGGSGKGVPLTAYTLIALHRNKNNSAMNIERLKQSIAKAMDFLERLLDHLTDSYSLCIVSYALALVGSSKADLAISKRDALAITTDDRKHWEKVDHSSSSQSHNWLFSRTSALNVEMTSYSLLTYCLKRDLVGSLPIARWLIDSMNPHGGFTSTQDTVVGIEALTCFATLLYGPNPGKFNLKLSAKIGAESHDFDPITPKNMLTLQIWEPLVTAGSAIISASGLGTALVQASVMYNVNRLPSGDSFDLTIKTQSKNHGNVVIVTTCLKWTKKDAKCGMAMETVELLSGYSFSSVDEVDKTGRGSIKKIEDNANEVSIYFDTISSKWICVAVTMFREIFIQNPKPANIKCFEYYNPNNYVTGSYECKDCNA